LHEVYYNAEGEPCAYTSDEVNVYGDTLEELEQSLRMMLADVEKSKGDILTPDDFHNEPDTCFDDEEE
jgi:hypothetical protein